MSRGCGRRMRRFCGRWRSPGGVSWGVCSVMKRSYNWLVSAQNSVVVAHIPLAVVDLQQSRVYHAALRALHVAVHWHPLPTRNRGRIAGCCCCGAAVNRCNAVTALCLSAQPRDQLDLLRKGQVLDATARTAWQLLVQRCHSREVVCDRGIFVHPREVATPQVDGLAVWRKARV